MDGWGLDPKTSSPSSASWSLGVNRGTPSSAVNRDCHHGNHVAIPWQSRGNHVAITWQSRGNHVAITWQSRGNPVAITWQSHGNHVANHSAIYSAVNRDSSRHARASQERIKHENRKERVGSKGKREEKGG